MSSVIDKENRLLDLGPTNFTGGFALALYQSPWSPLSCHSLGSPYIERLKGRILS